MAVFMKSRRTLAMGNVKCGETRHPGAEESANYCRTRCADSYTLYLITVAGESPVPFRARSGACLRQSLDSSVVSIVRYLPAAIPQALRVGDRTSDSAFLCRYPAAANELPLSSLLLPSRGEKQALQR